MSTVSTPNTLDKWQSKYLDSLDKNEMLEKTGLEREKALCKTIIHLSFSALGIDKELDPYLQKIQSQLKNTLQTDQLKTELEALSNALIKTKSADRQATEIDSTSFFSFFIRLFPLYERDLLKLRSKHKTDASSTVKILFDEIDFLLSQPKPESHDKDISQNTELILSKLQPLLNSSEIPSSLHPQVEQLKRKLRSPQPIATLLNETIALLLQLKDHSQAKEKDIIGFLSHLTDQLSEIGNEVANANQSSQLSIQKRNLLDESVSLQMAELQKSSKDATQLEPLKNLINTHISSITEQIQAHSDQEKNDQDNMKETERRMESLSARIVTMEAESKQLQSKLDIANKKATHDALTSLPNRLAYDTRLKIEMSRWKRYGTPVSLLIWDIDSFKQINDTYGHKSGDKTLILIGKLLSSHCRTTDFVSRFGGEEFTMLLSNTEAQSALLIANKIRQIIENTAFTSNGKKISITISCGLTQFTADDSGSAAFNRADKGLYDAKKSGRNQCCLNL